MARMQVAYTRDGISGTVLSGDFVTAENRWSLTFKLLFGIGFKKCLDSFPIFATINFSTEIK
jgi:hypothetical protein